MAEPIQIFEAVCEALERATYFNRMQARGTIRLAMRTMGADVRRVDIGQMTRVLDRQLPRELESRRVSDVSKVCAKVKACLMDLD